MNRTAAQEHSTDAARREPLIGLAVLAKLAYSGADLTPVGAQLMNRAVDDPDDANALMDLATVLHLAGNREVALSVQAQALEIQKVFRLAPEAEPRGIKVLVIMSPGDLTVNNALEFLVEGSDVTLDMLYVSTGAPLPSPLPAHDLAFVAVCESDQNRPLLEYIGSLLKDWPRPLLNAPDRIARLSRDRACELLRSPPGVVMPVTARVDRSALEQIGRGERPISSLLDVDVFPLIVRPVDSQKGQGLVKLDRPAAIADYLQSQPGSHFYVARFVDYRGRDGLYRKYRIVLIDGKPFVCHVAISDQWMVHYLSAGMTESAEKRAEEARIMATFDEDFARRHADALREIADRVQIEYVGIDCGETRDGKLLIFEFDSGMTVHAMDPVDLFPYKQPQMRKVFGAFRDMLVRTAQRAAA